MKIKTFLIAFFISVSLGFSQENIKSYEDTKAQESSPWEETNPLKLFLRIAIRTYQNTFSKLDGSTCQFRPSCSHFGSMAIKEHPIQGIFMTADRLQRCNPFTVGRYETHKDHTHIVDIIEDHLLFERKK